MSILKPHAGNLHQKLGPRVNFFAKGSELVLEFAYELEGEAYVDHGHGHEFKNWGLWESDVFEAFLTKSDSRLPYLEIQVSPLNQKFALLIETPREKSFYPKVAPFFSESSIEGGDWKAKMRIPFHNIPGQGEIIFGNLHAIIGEQREHYSLNPNPEATPDFHRPDLFSDLLGLSDTGDEPL